MDPSSLSVRALAAIAAACALLCIGAASAGAAPLLWTVNSGEGSISTFNSATNSEVGAPIPVAEHPQSVAITPDGKRAVVVAYGGVTVIETGSRTPGKTISSTENGERLAISPDGTTAYVTEEGDEEVHVLALGTGKFTGSFHAGPEAEAVAFSPDGKTAYVGTAPGQIVVVDTATRKVVGKPIVVGGFPTSVTFAPDGETAYVAAEGVNGVAVIDTALGEVVGKLAMTGVPTDLAMSPDGRQLYATSKGSETLTVFSTKTDIATGTPIKVGKEPGEVAFTPNGKTAYVAVYGDEVLQPIDTTTSVLGAPVVATGKGVSALVVAPDQSPIAGFTGPAATVGVPAAFSGAASSDPDGTITSWNWAFGDGGTATGVSATHAYGAPGTYDAKLSVVDNEGCGEGEVFTGRTAYCSGAPPAVHAVMVAAPSIAPLPPSNKFAIRRIVHNRRNGTVRLQVKLPSAGFVLLFGRKVHAVTRKSKGVQAMWLTIHARVKLAKRLKKTLRAPVRFRITFTPNGGTPRTVHRSVTLERAPRHRRHGH